VRGGTGKEELVRVIFFVASIRCVVSGLANGVSRDGLVMNYE
jgi:hypothetical protein